MQLDYQRECQIAAKPGGYGRRGSLPTLRTGRVILLSRKELTRGVGSRTNSWKRDVQTVCLARYKTPYDELKHFVDNCMHMPFHELLPICVEPSPTFSLTFTRGSFQNIQKNPARRQLWRGDAAKYTLLCRSSYTRTTPPQTTHNNYIHLHFLCLSYIDTLGLSQPFGTLLAICISHL